MDISNAPHRSDIIPVFPDSTIAALFRERVARTPHHLAYRQFDEDSQRWRDYTWKQTAADVARWQALLKKRGMKKGNHVGIMLPNRREWSLFDLAALGMGLVLVPLYNNDRGENAAYILKHSECKLLFIEGEEQWRELKPHKKEFSRIKSILTLNPVQDDDKRLTWVKPLLPDRGKLIKKESGPDDTATIVYTSGTTGKPKGVMLSHQNILTNAAGGLQLVPAYTDDVFLSFLPLSHMLERMAGYYLPMMAGSAIAYARGIPELAEDFINIRPTGLFSVPRIYERIYAKLMEQLEAKPPIARKLFEMAVKSGWHSFEYDQGRAHWGPDLLLWPVLKKLVASKIHEKMGGRLRVAITGGAAMPPCVTKVFVGLHVPLLQGYGLTETSPLISVNSFESNDPASVGIPIPGVEVMLGENDELLTRGPHVMLGYWKDKKATKEIIDRDGWLHTGDQARIENNHIYLIGRIKEIIVLSTGEKIPPGDMETIAANDPLFEQVLIHGEGRPYLVALVVLNEDRWRKIAGKHGLQDHEPDHEAVERLLLKHLARRLEAFPGYARIRRARFTMEAWSIANGYMTPTMKLRRNAIAEANRELLDSMYQGHTVESASDD